MENEVTSETASLLTEKLSGKARELIKLSSTLMAASAAAGPAAASRPRVQTFPIIEKDQIESSSTQDSSVLPEQSILLENILHFLKEEGSREGICIDSLKKCATISDLYEQVWPCLNLGLMRKLVEASSSTQSQSCNSESRLSVVVKISKNMGLLPHLGSGLSFRELVLVLALSWVIY